MTRTKTPPLLAEIERLREENEELKETIKNASFSDNPMLFAVNKTSDNYFGHVTVVDTIQLLKSLELEKRQLINFGWELAGTE